MGLPKEVYQGSHYACFADPIWARKHYDVRKAEDFNDVYSRYFFKLNEVSRMVRSRQFLKFLYDFTRKYGTQDCSAPLCKFSHKGSESASFY